MLPILLVRVTSRWQPVRTGTREMATTTSIRTTLLTTMKGWKNVRDSIVGQIPELRLVLEQVQVYLEGLGHEILVGSMVRYLAVAMVETQRRANGCRSKAAAKSG